ncbi:sphingosine hydroxylase [Gloeophyllum trabeum ATCC 11539]|uniref:Sphingosine hydroxylase n=1 Tax=Gloeophyllum trabeum (strain ATCC 11539 / FP-39264 / Madison 617) TaxID=670483 RepID=S7QAG3_GLOTA|nr:sphingosine hydroxylase [Gloeophyllum trabeum ATCC 11539]EPQ56368.1 sphingosine hydroxylase [Gloeophyllum trabeum ATCC 11539]
MNHTVLTTAYPDFSLPDKTPFYYSPSSELIPGIPDHATSLAAPIIAYWVVSLVFHVLDMSEWKWLDKYRIHESSEVKSRNLVTRWEVVKAVVFQHIIQTLLGYFWMEPSVSGAGVDHLGNMRALSVKVAFWVKAFMGQTAGGRFLIANGGELTYFMYWWGIPIAKFLFAMFMIDTWQYFWHRAMHVNKWMYKHFHSVHHRLYVPYAFGALYNHPVEGFVLDSMGAGVAEALAGLTLREAALLFVISTFKTVDDHCGYKLPFDPLQWMTSNNADYHDIHHQVVGIKSNFAQPFFTHWDVILGTRMTRKDIELRRQKARGMTD